MTSGGAARPARFGVRAARVFDGERVRGPGVVQVDGGRVTAVHTDGGPPAGLPVTDLGAGTTVLPGLVDTHTHLALDATAAAVDRVRAAAADELTAWMRTAARRSLAVGITTARDLGDRDFLSLSLRDALAADPCAGPQLLCAGPPVTTPKGHCWFLGGEVAGPDELRRAVAERAERGVDVVKVMATGGELTAGTDPGEAQFDAETLSVLVDEAHGHGLPVAAHAHGADGIRIALAAGVDTIEHCSFLTANGVEPDEDLIAAVGAADVVVSMTLGFAPGVPLPPRIATNLPRIQALLRMLVTSGATVALGSDAGINPPKPHDVLPHGIAMFAEASGAADALAAATSRAAEACGVGDRKGRLAPGFDADLLVLGGDPFADIAAVHDVRAVYRAGVLVHTDEGDGS